MLEKDRFEILLKTGGESISGIDLVQELWSGYGSISRVHLTGSERNSVIVKNIVQPIISNHPRGWNTEISNARKIKSYEVETNWYALYSDKCDEHCRIPTFMNSWERTDQRFILLEDLNDAGFPYRKSDLDIN